MPSRKGRISEDDDECRVADVLRVKFELGLFDEPFVDAARAPAIVHQPDHEAATLEAARKAMVLLKNEQGHVAAGPGCRLEPCWSPVPARTMWSR